MATNNKTSTLKAVTELMKEALWQVTPEKLRKGCGKLQKQWNQLFLDSEDRTENIKSPLMLKIIHHNEFISCKGIRLAFDPKSILCLLYYL
jgi:hypothetical protein